MEVLIAGDFVPSNRVETLIDKGNYTEVLSNVRTFTDKVDYSIVNLEAPVVDSIDAKPILKTGPNLKCSVHAINALKYAGFDCVTLANNHFRDYGDKGVEATLKYCEKFNIDYVGGGRNLQSASKILYKKIHNQILAIINVCENEWSIASVKSGGSCPLNVINTYYKIKEAKSSADFVIVIVHGGTEHYNLPTPRMKETYRYFVDCGVDAVINHHQHCYSGYELYNNKPIFYGLGNFCFDQGVDTPEFWNKGFLVKLKLDDQISFELLPYTQCRIKPTVDFDVTKRDFEDQINHLNSIIADDHLLEDHFQQFVNSHIQSMSFIFEPFQNRIFDFFNSHHLLPSFVSQKKYLKILAFFRCESHRDIMFNMLIKKLNQEK